MRPVAGAFTPHDEVDELAWLPPLEAREKLSYVRDLTLLDALR
jgi:8-oxo-dGTP diphosphatase